MDSSPSPSHPHQEVVRRGMVSWLTQPPQGVARVSVGSWPGLAALTLARNIAQELLGAGTYTFAASAITYPEANAMMKRRGPAPRS